MTSATTARDTDRQRTNRETDPSSGQMPDHRPRPGKRHGNSRTMTIAMILGAIAFVVCLALIALGGDNAASEPASVATTSPASDSSTDQPAAQDSTENASDQPLAEPTVDTTAATDEDPTGETDEPTTDTQPVETAEQAVVEPLTEPSTEPAAVRAPVIDPSIDYPPVPPGAPDTWYSVLSDGKIFLRGIVPTAEVEGLIVSAVEQVLGAGNVISEYAIDPNEPFDPQRPNPVFINDTITFESGSTEIAPDFYPLIATTPILLEVQPSVVVTITGYTDSQGSEEVNLTLSQARVDAVRDWIISQGGDGERLIAIGKGEVEPVADNDTEEGRQANRRVEFLVEGFDFTLGG